MKKVVQELAGYLTTAFGSSHTVYQGYVEGVGLSKLPCIQVYGISTSQDHHSTGKDRITHTMGIRVVENMNTKLSESGTGGIINGQTDLYDFMEKRTSNGIPDADSVVGVLTRNIKGTNYLFNNDYSIDYTNVEEKQGSQYVVAEMQFSITYLALRQ